MRTSSDPSGIWQSGLLTIALSGACTSSLHRPLRQQEVTVRRSIAAHACVHAQHAGYITRASETAEIYARSPIGELLARRKPVLQAISARPRGNSIKPPRLPWRTLCDPRTGISAQILP